MIYFHLIYFVIQNNLYLFEHYLVFHLLNKNYFVFYEFEIIYQELIFLEYYNNLYKILYYYIY